jgi:dienelactone hydrolase
MPRITATLRVVSLALLLPGLPGAASPAAAGGPVPAPHSPPTGDWIGWAYLDAGGDLPLRIRIEPAAGPSALPSARFDEMVSRCYDLPAVVEAWNADGVVLVRRQPGGGEIRLEGRFQDGSLRGRLQWLGHEGNFELMPATESISRTPPETFADAEGTYRLEDGRTLVISKRFWGELLVSELGSGRVATLIPTDTDEFMMGSALYVPTPAHARLRFVRDEDGRVTELGYQETGRPEAVTGARLAFREEEIDFTSDGIRLAGTLLRPDVHGRLPAVVLLGGAYWDTRGSVRAEAALMASFGLAVLIYDKRGFGESEGEQTVSFQQTARDAAAAVRALAERSDVMPDQIGLSGRSRSAWFAPLAAFLSERAAFLVLFVPPAVSPARQETASRLHGLAEEGVAGSALEAARLALESGWEWAATGEGWPRHAAARAAAVAAGVPEDVLEAADPEDPAWEWVKLNMSYDPLPVLEQIRCPVLALFGGVDRTVDPEMNLPLLRSALQRAGNSDVTLLVLPDADHGLRRIPAGERPLPPHRQTGAGGRGWPEVERWLAERLSRGAGGGT